MADKKLERRKDGRPTTGKVGKPTKLTPVIQKIIAGAVSRGLTYELASNLAEIHPKTVGNWLKMGEFDLQEGNDTEYVRFYSAVSKAHASYADTLMQRAESQSYEDAPGTRWLLERVYRKHYGKDAGEISEMKEMLATFIAGNNPELEKLKQENEELKAKLAKDSSK